MRTLLSAHTHTHSCSVRKQAQFCPLTACRLSLWNTFWFTAPDRGQRSAAKRALVTKFDTQWQNSHTHTDTMRVKESSILTMDQDL